MLGAGMIPRAQAAAHAEPVPAIQPFSNTPVFVPLRTEKHVTITRTALTYRLVDGREIEGWGADLYTPSDASAPGAAPPDAATTHLATADSAPADNAPPPTAGSRAL